MKVIANIVAAVSALTWFTFILLSIRSHSHKDGLHHRLSDFKGISRGISARSLRGEVELSLVTASPVTPARHGTWQWESKLIPADAEAYLMPVGLILDWGGFWGSFGIGAATTDY